MVKIGAESRVRNQMRVMDVPRRPRDAARSVLRRFDLDVVRYSPEAFLPLRRLAILRQQHVGVVLDVGANAGQYAEKLRSDGWSGRIVSFEPLTRAYADLERLAAKDP